MKELQFEEEKKLVRDLRYNKKLKYSEIAKRLNRSLYWVHCRLSDKYRPAGSRVEKKFQNWRYFSSGFLSYLKEEFSIHIVFV